MLHLAAVDPFKLALYKLMGRLEPSRRPAPHAKSTLEDWMWFQLAMVRLSFRLVDTCINAIQIDEEEDGGLQALTGVLLDYGERHFSSLWPNILVMCGQFERVSN